MSSRIIRSIDGGFMKASHPSLFVAGLFLYYGLFIIYYKCFWSFSGTVSLSGTDN